MAENKQRIAWSSSDEKVLLDLWGERAGDLQRAKRNLHIYADISANMNSKFTAKEVHVKIRNLTQRYREEKKKVGPSGGSPSEWKHFDAVHQILGLTAANNAETFESFSMDISSSALLSSPSPTPDPLSPTVASTSQMPVAEQSQPPQLPPPLSSPVLPLGSSPPLSPLDTSSTSMASCSGKKRNYMGELIKVAKEQNELLKTVVAYGKELTTKVVNAIEEQNNTTKEFVNIMKSILEKM